MGYITTEMIPCPKLPIFIYGDLYSTFKLVVLAGKIEGSMRARLNQYKQKERGIIDKTGNDNDYLLGELLWINLEKYDQLINELDAYANSNKKEPYERFACTPITNEPIYRAIKPTSVDAWSYKII